MTNYSYSDNFNAYYGIAPMTLEQEANAPEPVRQTRQNKVRMMDDCAAIQRWIDANVARVRAIPEMNDADHAKRVQKWADNIHMARVALEMY